VIERLQLSNESVFFLSNDTGVVENRIAGCFAGARISAAVPHTFSNDECPVSVLMPKGLGQAVLLLRPFSMVARNTQDCERTAGSKKVLCGSSLISISGT
jgi:hypothetical protein